MKKTVGDRYESDTGMGFVITNVENGVTTVDIDRFSRKTGELTKFTRQVPDNIWRFFVLPYKKKRRTAVKK